MNTTDTTLSTLCEQEEANKQRIASAPSSNPSTANLANPTNPTSSEHTSSPSILVGTHISGAVPVNLPTVITTMDTINPSANLETFTTAFLHTTVQRSPNRSVFVQSKRPIYNKNVYIQYLIDHLVQANPYISLPEILNVLDQRQIQYKETTVANLRKKSRSRYITSLDDLLSEIIRMSKFYS